MMNEPPSSNSRNGGSIFKDEFLLIPSPPSVHEEEGGRGGGGTGANADIMTTDVEDGKADSESDDDDVQTYPADCYSFVALHSPFDGLGFWSFGVFVWTFQIGFLILFVLRVVSKKHSTNEDVGNPGTGGSGVGTSVIWETLSTFIPPNIDPLARATQYFAILSYCMFADDSVKDVVAAVETFPNLKKAKTGDKVGCLIFSCVLRFTQGMLACFVVWLLVVNTTDVIDIVLNFTAVNFISAFDDAAFELAQWGKYGPTLETESNRIEEAPLPPCLIQKYKHKRYRLIVIPLAILLLSAVSGVAFYQNISSAWRTQSLRVQFDEGTGLGSYSGCYHLDVDEKGDATKVDDNGKRLLYASDLQNEVQAKIGYCKEHSSSSNRKWLLFKGNGTSACLNDDNLDVLAKSQTIYDHDISSSFEVDWSSRTGTPLELYFFGEDEDNYDDIQCGSFLGDGVCNDLFNIPSYLFDEGDCCSSTCDGSFSCGIGEVTNAFETIVTGGDGYPTCIDPTQDAITIRINSVYVAEESGFGGGDDDGFLGDQPPRNPLLVLDCDGSNVLMITIVPAMENETETVMVGDGAECILSIKNVTSGGVDINFVNYTIFHGDEASIDDNPIIMMEADSYIDGIIHFQRIRDCFFNKLSLYTDNTTIYTGTEPQNKAIDWLMEDSLGASACEYDTFVERYALAVINFAAPIDMSLTNPAYNETSSEKLISDSLWIENDRQCAWSNVACQNGLVLDLDLGSTGLGNQISGTIATEIGLLKNLNKTDMSFNNIYGSIPSEVGLLASLEYINFGSNALTGSIPSEVGMMGNLTWFFADTNLLTGTIPSQVQMMTSLLGFLVYSNTLTGSIPSEFGNMESLEYLLVLLNAMTGTIPSQLGQLQNLIYLGLSYNDLTGTIPSTLDQLINAENFELNDNKLTGSLPVSIVLNRTYVNFDVTGNLLSDLPPVDGQAICSTINNFTGVEDEQYCNCATDCLVKDAEYPTTNKFGKKCQCEEALDCCDTYFVEYKITNCVFCEAEGGFLNPDYLVPEWDYFPCGLASDFVYTVSGDFGTEEQCNEARIEGYNQGCICPDYIPPDVSEVDANERV
mmetsp:Transcript_63806/g.71312  ORF Transcript_63806/g.71312 Transcript_63806/m.71312 type:complete len:1086 (-) Transcript_63806:338-3595(-)